MPTLRASSRMMSSTVKIRASLQQALPTLENLKNGGTFVRGSERHRPEDVHAGMPRRRFPFGRGFRFVRNASNGARVNYIGTETIITLAQRLWGSAHAQSRHHRRPNRLLDSSARGS